jgi:hypothetical protein
VKSASVNKLESSKIVRLLTLSEVALTLSACHYLISLTGARFCGEHLSTLSVQAPAQTE